MTFDELQTIVSQISFRDWEFRVMKKGDGYLLQVRFWAPDSTTGNPTSVLQSCRKWYVSQHASKAEVVRTAWKAVEAAVLHEAQELFLYRGLALYNPHLDPDSVTEVKKQPRNG